MTEKLSSVYILYIKHGWTYTKWKASDSVKRLAMLDPGKNSFNEFTFIISSEYGHLLYKINYLIEVKSPAYMIYFKEEFYYYLII